MLLEVELDKRKIKTSFAKACDSYDAMAKLQRRVGRALLSTANITGLTGTVLDIGSGTGFLTGELCALSGYQRIIALDIALPMLQIARHKLADTVCYVCADAEFLPLQNHSVDSIFSNLALQWCQDLDAVFAEFKRVLKPAGCLTFSTFGATTLHELKAAWASVDGYTHVNQFYNADEVVDFLAQAGYQQISIEKNLYRSEYGTVMELMHELKAIGAHNVTAGRNRRMTTKNQLQMMIARYEKLRVNGFIPATFEVLNITAQV